MHEAHHVAYGVHRAHHFLFQSFIAEHLHLVGEVQVICDGVRLIGETVFQVLVGLCPFGQVFDEIRDFLVVLVLPRRRVAPVLVEALLYDFHLLAGGFFRIFLHACVQGRINFQSVGIEVEFVVGIGTGNESFFA